MYHHSKELNHYRKYILVPWTPFLWGFLYLFSFPRHVHYRHQLLSQPSAMLWKASPTSSMATVCCQALDFCREPTSLLAWCNVIFPVALSLQLLHDVNRPWPWNDPNRNIPPQVPFMQQWPVPPPPPPPLPQGPWRSPHRDKPLFSRNSPTTLNVLTSSDREDFSNW